MSLGGIPLPTLKGARHADGRRCAGGQQTIDTLPVSEHEVHEDQASHEDDDVLHPQLAEDLLKEALADATQKNKKSLQIDDVIVIAERKTNIPIHLAGEKEAKKLLGLEKTIHQRLIDQEEAVKAVSRAATPAIAAAASADAADASDASAIADAASADASARERDWQYRHLPKRIRPIVD